MLLVTVCSNVGFQVKMSACVLLQIKYFSFNFGLKLYDKICKIFNSPARKTELKECLLCCRCGKQFDCLSDVDVHSYLEYLDLFKTNVVANDWTCYGCLKKFKDWVDYYVHFRKVWLKPNPQDNLAQLNLVKIRRKASKSVSWLEKLEPIKEK